MSWEEKKYSSTWFYRWEEEINPHSVSQRFTLGKNIQTVGLLKPFLDSFMHLSPVSLYMNLQLEFLGISGAVSQLCSPCQGSSLGRRKPRPQMQILPQLPNPTRGCDGDKDKVLCSHLNHSQADFSCTYCLHTLLFLSPYVKPDDS